MNKMTKSGIWYILAIAIVASIPLMTDYVLKAEDLASTLSHIEVIGREMTGHFPMRIGTWGSLDYGYEAASFQANVWYLLPALLCRLGMGVGNAYKWALFFCNLSTAGMAALCFQKCLKRRDIGLMAAMLYTWCPYRCSAMYLTGSYGETVAWTFLPVVIWGLSLLYEEDGRESSPAAVLAWGYSLLALSSTVVLTGALVMTLLWLAVMGRRTLRRRVWMNLGLAAGIVLMVNAWFLIPMLLRLRDASAVGILIPRDIRARGMYLAQYLSIYAWGGAIPDPVENGMQGAPAMGPGIAVILSVAVMLWLWFTGQRKKSDETALIGRLLILCGILMFLSSNLFPWDLLQNKNMLFSVILALVYTPAKLGIVADAGLILVCCRFLAGLTEDWRPNRRKIGILGMAAISFGTVQFQLGNILKNGAFARGAELESMAALSLPVVAQESLLWRCSEALSLAALCVCAAIWMIRRRKDVKRI
ncbi:MAG: hypothetical protein NC091_09200 [Bacteroides sp.]|nr:hypothetical protein [Bacteroides sp.]